MDAEVPRRRKWRFAVLVGALFIVLVAVSTFWSSPAARTLSARAPQTKRVHVRSFVKDLKVVGIHRQGDDVRLTLRNDYSQHITAFVLSPGPYPGTYTITSDFVPDDGIAPRATHETRCTLPSKQQGDDRVITLVALVFEDGGGLGDRRFIDAISQNRLGKKLASQLMIPYFEMVIAAPDHRFANDLALAKAGIDALSEPEKASFDFVSGFKNAKELALSQLDTIDRARETEETRHLRESLMNRIERYRKTANRF